ncbi:hypothetical protein PAALTS15_20723 [Paenibacillus alvei TS-15]|uniref:Uncharacterized protein n=1 Tax=Paenibacillus alvei TS-15 TaxID=1117108 RepID=S9SMP2_PAEAL|nr:hypothetical protein [Paenibacillus alvei]EPY05353.1 hypothetical protein PAALTS15_20723 [Paenibacillus alvei TS-15]
MKLFKYELEPFIQFLHRLQLEREHSRMRTRFKKLLIEHYQQFTADLNEINQYYLARDDDGNPLMIDDKYQFSDNDQCIQEIEQLAREEVIIEQNDSNATMLQSIRESVLHRSPLEYAGEEADHYDRFCEIVEQIHA